MKARWVRMGVLAVLLCAIDQALAGGSNVEALYRENCASCHGVKLNEGPGGSLVDGVWKYGESDPLIAKAISNGNSDVGMPAFRETLSPEVIRSLVIFIREEESAARQSGAPKTKTIPGAPVRTPYGAYIVEPVVSSGLETPWALAFLADGRKLVTEKPGRLKMLDEKWKLEPKPVVGTPVVVVSSQGGLLDVAPAPDFEKSGWIYLSYSSPATGNVNSSMTKISRGRIVDNKWIDEETIFKMGPGFYTSSGRHFGSRIIFDRGFVYFSIGERGDENKAQNLALPNGKIFRVLPDGKIPADNPFVDRKDALAAVWSYGHRNPQGLVVDPRDHAIYETEHGPRGGDEFNRIRKGANYGWPLVCFGMNYNGTPISAHTEQEGIEPPLLQWTPSIGTCGLAFYDGDKFPAWKGDFFAGGLRGSLHRLRVVDGKVTEKEVMLEGLGRVRDVRCGPEGFLYVVLNNPDMIVRLVPAGAESVGKK